MYFATAVDTCANAMRVTFLECCSFHLQAQTDNYVVDLTTVHRRLQEPSTAQNSDDFCIIASDTSPAAKQRNIAVANVLQAHRKAGQQIAANTHNIRQASEPREVESKPKCGICLDEMKEPACGSCG